MVLRSFHFSSIKTSRFYLLQNQSSAAGSQPNAAFWCSLLSKTSKIPTVFPLSRTFHKVNIDAPRHTHANLSVWKSRHQTEMMRGWKLKNSLRESRNSREFAHSDNYPSSFL